MLYVCVLLFGILAGGISVFAILVTRRGRLQDREVQVQAQELRANQLILEAETHRLELAEQYKALKEARAEFDGRAVSYNELAQENAILKHDLQNIDVNVRKLELDCEIQAERQEAIDKRTQDLGSRFLKDNVKWARSSLSPTNFASSKERLQKIIGWCRAIRLSISTQEEDALMSDLRSEYESVVRAAFEREEQARIRAQIREEQKLEREIERELKQLEREHSALQAALEKALAEAKDEHSAEVEHLKARLAEAEENSRRAVSRAQMTKSGHVYVISNIGSFGDNVFKIGMSRRLEPLDRVKELGDASVPFPFDVHMMISSDDAPSLENALHRELHRLRLNKANPRKEFFRTNIEDIHRIVGDHHGEVEYVADAEALEYRQSVDMSDEDLEFIEHVFKEAEKKGKNLANDN